MIRRPARKKTICRTESRRMAFLFPQSGTDSGVAQAVVPPKVVGHLQDHVPQL